MDITIRQQGDSKVAVITSNELLVSTAEEALDILATVQYIYSCDKILLFKENIHESFFDLKTKLAGDVLQKFTTYKVCVAIVGDYSSYTSKSLKDFIYESNKNGHIYFLPTEEEALESLHKSTMRPE